MFQVYHEDFFGRHELCKSLDDHVTCDDIIALPPDGYGFVTVPTTPGIHDVSCVTWRPVGSHRQQFSCTSLTTISSFLVFSLCFLCSVFILLVLFSLSVSLLPSLISPLLFGVPCVLLLFYVFCSTQSLLHSILLSYHLPPSSLTPAFFLGGSPELTSDSLIHSCHDRQHLRTQAMGRVHLRLMIILRHLSHFGVEVS